MTDIDRRALMGVLGAGAALAVCESPANSKIAEKVNLDFFGYFPNFGDLATIEKPSKLGNVTSFQPKYLCVVYLRFNANGSFTARHGYKVYEPAWDAAREKTEASAMIKDGLNGTGYPTGENDNNQYRRDNFDDFTQASQQKIWIFLDNKPDKIAFDDRNGKDYIIRFTPTSSDDPESKLPRNKDRKIRSNNAYCNLDLKSGLAIVGATGTTALTLEYWNTNEIGNAVTGVIKNDISTHYIYSINIHLKLAMRRKNTLDRWVPVVIDPDTGNMGSNP